MRKPKQKICEQCGYIFEFNCHPNEYRSRRFCSKKCKAIAFSKHTSKIMSGKNNPNYGKKPWNYKGGTIVLSGSKNIKYIELNIKGKHVRKHRYIMEKHLGRKLKRNEVVHHIDGNRLNNAMGRILKIEVDTGEFIIIEKTTMIFSQAYLSRDGKYFYYAKPVHGTGAQIMIHPVGQRTDKGETPVTYSYWVNGDVKYSRDGWMDWYTE